MKRLALFAVMFAAAPAVAQEGRYVDPSPVNFERPFLYDGVRARGLPEPKGEPIPIDEWLANGRTIEGLPRKAEPPKMVLDEKLLRDLFRDDLPSLTEPDDPPPSSER